MSLESQTRVATFGIFLKTNDRKEGIFTLCYWTVFAKETDLTNLSYHRNNPLSFFLYLPSTNIKSSDPYSTSQSTYNYARSKNQHMQPDLFRRSWLDPPNIRLFFFKVYKRLKMRLPRCVMHSTQLHSCVSAHKSILRKSKC